MITIPLRAGLRCGLSSQIRGQADAPPDPAGVAYNANLTADGKSLSAAESATNLKYAKQLTDAGFSSTSIELAITGWNNPSANLRKFYSGVCTESGTNTHAAGGVTTGATGVIRTGLIPSVVGFGGFALYTKSTRTSATRIQWGCYDGSFNTQGMALNWSSNTFILWYHTQSGTTGRVNVAPGQTTAGLYSMQRLSNTTQRLVKTDSGGNTIIDTTAMLSATGLSSAELVIGGWNQNGTLGNYSQETIAGWLYVKTALTTTQWDTLHSILYSWIGELGFGL